MKVQNRTKQIQTACSNLTNSTLACQKHPPPHRPLLKDLSLTPGIALVNSERGCNWVTGVNHSQNNAETTFFLTTIHSQTAGHLSMIILFCLVVLTCFNMFWSIPKMWAISTNIWNQQVLRIQSNIKHMPSGCVKTLQWDPSFIPELRHVWCVASGQI